MEVRPCRRSRKPARKSTHNRQGSVTTAPKVRSGLAAGGRWIRTSGSARQVDVGTVANPIGLKGQIHGGDGQGRRHALVSSRRAGGLAAKTSPIAGGQTDAPALRNRPTPNT